jgi:serine protease Do
MIRVSAVGVAIATCFACKGEAQPVPAADASPQPAAAVLAPKSVSLASVAPLSFAPIVKASDPSVVTIRTSLADTRGNTHEGVGTGFIIDKDGMILTNNHVVGGAKSVSVRLSDERDFTARVVGFDAPTDMAVLQIKDASNPSSFSAIAMADSDATEIGDWVVAIGNPFRLSHSVSVGIVSGKGRTQEDVPLDPAGYYDFLQTDASINPGNSGGPLLNLQGEVVGINTAIRAGGANNIGFAIPINMVKQLLPMLIRDGKVARSALGVQIRDIRDFTAEQRAEMKLSVSVTRGALVQAVSENGAAAKAKLRAGDVITSFEGEPIDKAMKLQWLASLGGVGKVVTLKIVRQGEPSPIEKKLTLQELAPPKPEPPPKASKREMNFE